MPPAALEAFSAVLDAAGIIDGTAPEAGRYLHDWTGDYLGTALAVLRPRSVEEVQALVRICAEHRVPIVPQGGNTGLVAGATAGGPPSVVVVSLERLNRIREIDAANFTLRADAGAVLQTLKDAAESEDMLFPLALGAQGSCQIGGNVATNAGGINVLRYGMMRDLVLGLEAVMPDGSLWEGMTGLRKDNRGYDLKQLLIGSEGSLSIVTGVEVKLFPRPANLETAYLGVSSFADAMALSGMARSVCSDLLTAFEVIGSECIAFAALSNPETRVPLEGEWPVHVLMELGCSSAIDGRALLEALLGEAFEAGLLGDGTIAQSRAHARAFWAIREDLVEGQAKRGRHVRTDLSVRLSDVARMIEAARSYVLSSWPGWEPIAYGHAGDGNIHFNVMPPLALSTGEIREQGRDLLDGLYGIVRGFGGSFSAEHGVGRSRRAVYWQWLTPEQQKAVSAIKAVFDPLGIMNPGCLVVSD
ncbi:FAD-binding oxidoreductase [Mesorhizobium sp.]|uniref:FAD-binding oxidoreductase n=1 Tax=Mesorhizobium sp. TaxID=1871066 RepID=UPI00120FA359|nr:FAD-binding oxidoreductase [Mesorhizobium sp.]TIO09440.1 MAG: FAD-binding oxidoreductase [Mesorhizobium sp.]TIO33349.1 MAG: FAD-binding oxidoreductase [Mesorhizobium sp.]TIP09409.1 MAG: FAD-binding oxidoreductase [Mesorhizobium sp.]